MVQVETNLKVADNSGAKVVRIFRIKGGSVKKSASVGDIVTGVIVRTKKGVKRENGAVIKFDDNAVVLLKKDGMPVGTRVFGPVARELRGISDGCTKITSMAPEVL